ncbi:MAG: TIGR01777 family oxidoreductase [Elusimicrobia bacterium]|nr:TIGR01777 family protein [Elusimicrobiota bacterium]MBP9127373.1 TIGR01777 family oxidoreductase [Elusimicrobiota bacterium]
MKILVSGATGLIGGALVNALEIDRHEVTALSRSEAVQAPRLLWDPERGKIDARMLDGFNAVVHLAGESIAAGRWTPLMKERIRESRCRGTGLLAQTVAAVSRPPQVFVCASAIGFYGDRGDEVLTENSPAGTGFLADVCREWESACRPAAARGIRVVHARFGVVLSRRGGALKKMLPPFRWGLGGKIGSGRQWWSWIGLSDVVGAIQQTLKDGSLSGPVNVTAPGPVRHDEFIRILGRVLRRPAVTPLPAFAAKLVLGEMADALLLASARVEPRKLIQSGYVFRAPTLAQALTEA